MEIKSVFKLIKNIWDDDVDLGLFTSKQKAEEYAKMNSEEFNSKISNELKLAGKYSATFGCFIFLIIGVLVNIWAVFEIGPFALLSVIAFGGGAIYLYNISLKGYFEERKDL